MIGFVARGQQALRALEFRPTSSAQAFARPIDEIR